MGCWEVDGNGNTKVHRFTVTTRYADGEKFGDDLFGFFTDYVAGIDWARREIYDIETSDPDYGTEDAWVNTYDDDSIWLPDERNDEFWEADDDEKNRIFEEILNSEKEDE